VAVEPLFTSVTEIDTLFLCRRKWAFRWLQGLKPDRPAKALGLQVHEALAYWVTSGKPLDRSSEAGRIAFGGISLLPAPRSEGVDVERWFGLRINGIIVRGCKDLEEYSRNPPRVTDHKTTSKLQYAMTEDALLLDTQAGVYAADAMVRAGSQTCDVRWIYYPTKGKALPLVVERNLTRSDVEPTLARCVQAGSAIQRIRSSRITPLEIPPNPRACDRYGECEYLDLCRDVSRSRKVRQNMSEPESLDDFLSSLEKKPQAINPPPKEEAKPAPKPRAKAAPKQMSLDEFEAAKPEPKATDTIPSPPPTEVGAAPMLEAMAVMFDAMARACRAARTR
jgi:hypothetical protein